MGESKVIPIASRSRGGGGGAGGGMGLVLRFRVTVPSLGARRVASPFAASAAPLRVSLGGGSGLSALAIGRTLCASSLAPPSTRQGIAVFTFVKGKNLCQFV